MTANIDAAKALINARLAGGNSGSITAEKLRDSLIAGFDAVIADLIAANISYSSATSPLTAGDVESALDEVAAILNQKAPLASPALTGTPTAPSAAKQVSSSQIGTTAFVHSVVADYAPLASPALTGAPTAPTAPPGTNTTQIATTAFATAAVASAAALNGIEPGDILPMLDTTPPSGFVELDGATIVGGAATYPTVATRYAWMVSSGDLILPDMRGRVLRGWDNGAGVDPDAASRTARAGDGQTGDYPGTYQADEFKSHTHQQRWSQAAGQVALGGNLGAPIATATSAAGGNETRGKNIAVMFCMKMG